MKTIGIILTLVLAVFGNYDAAAQQDSSKAMKQQKILVVYYSWSGNTEAVAKKIQAETKADLFKIELQNLILWTIRLVWTNTVLINGKTVYVR